MSNAFSFMFGFYGLLLSFALAEVASGFSRAYDSRKQRPLGIVAPLFGLLLLVDLITFWMNAWSYRDLAEVTFVTALAVAFVALLYYFAATQIFPKASDKDTLDAHIMEHRRIVVFCVLASNLMTQIPQAFLAVTTPWPASDVALWLGLNSIYYVLLVSAAFVSSKRVVAALVALAIAYVTTATVVFS